MKMKKVTKVLWALAILAGLSIGCAGAKEEAKIRCPKCGVLFKVETDSQGAHRGKY